MRSFQALVTSCLAVGALGAPLEPHEVKRAAAGTAYVALAQPSGSPQHLASGFLYGIPIAQNQVPDHFYTDMGFNYGRSGGGSQNAPARGWAYGNTEFLNRFKAPASYYQTVRKYGARMQLLIADIWGADGRYKISMPGDNGDWSSYDNFLNALFNAIRNNGMTNYLDLEIWNEPDLNNLFWQRDQNQYLQMWGRGYHKIKSAFPNNILNGPCTSSDPNANNGWLKNYLSFIKANGSVPDAYCWHLELGSGDDLQTTLPAWNSLLSQYGLPQRPIICNEYATQKEQQPSSAVWWISRLERYNVRGLRGNWAQDGSYDYFAGLLGKPNANTPQYSPTQAGYWNNGEYNVYKFYYREMTGQRATTYGSSDGRFDVYATVDGNARVANILSGTRLASGTYSITITGLNAIGLPSSGNVNVRTLQFNYGGALGNVPSYTDLGTSSHGYSNNELRLNINSDSSTAYGFKILG